MGSRFSDADQDRDGTVLDELQHELAIARRNVREAPNCLKLKLGRLDGLAQLQQAWDHIHVDRLLNRRVLFK